MSKSPVLDVQRLGNPPWRTSDPFLFCVHHDDAYPAGNEKMGPKASLAGRHIGMDFAGIDGWRMYHGDVVPGFPQHPHRGFETITLARRGLIDHSDSLGATARFGKGDVQWMTAGRGIVHAEMFPLVDKKGPNPLELFQIWINLPRKDKMVDPYFRMLWSDTIPMKRFNDEAGGAGHTEVTVIAGKIGEHVAPKPPPNSWAAQPSADVAIWTLRMPPGATWTLPPASKEANRTLFFFRGDALVVEGERYPKESRLEVRSDAKLKLTAGKEECQVLMLQGKPIHEPVVQYGPFVMNTKEEIQDAFLDYRATGFGGWPWSSEGPVHAREKERFAKHADGKVERGT